MNTVFTETCSRQSDGGVRQWQLGAAGDLECVANGLHAAAEEGSTVFCDTLNVGEAGRTRLETIQGDEPSVPHV